MNKKYYYHQLFFSSFETIGYYIWPESKDDGQK